MSSYQVTNNDATINNYKKDSNYDKIVNKKRCCIFCLSVIALVGMAVALYCIGGGHVLSTIAHWKDLTKLAVFLPSSALVVVVVGAILFKLIQNSMRKKEIEDTLDAWENKRSSKYLNKMDREGKTPLAKAIEYGDEKLVQALLEAGASSVISGNNSNRPLQLAYGKNNLNILLMIINDRIINKNSNKLIENIEIKQPNTNLYCALNWTVERDDKILANYLLDKIKKNDAIEMIKQYASIEENQQLIKFFEEDAKNNQPMQYNPPPLYFNPFFNNNVQVV